MTCCMILCVGLNFRSMNCNITSIKIPPFRICLNIYFEDSRMSVISMGLIRNIQLIQVQVCNIANDTAFGDTQYICTRYPNFPFHPQFMQTPPKISQSTVVVKLQTSSKSPVNQPLVNYCDLLLHDLDSIQQVVSISLSSQC